MKTNSELNPDSVAGNCNCHSYNGDFGKKPEVALPKPSWSDRHGDTIMVDACIADTVKAIWDAGHITLSSCCGHSQGVPSLVLDGSDSDEADAIRTIIRKVDGREFGLFAWQLVELTHNDGKELIDE